MSDPEEKSIKYIFIPISTETTLRQQYERVQAEDEQLSEIERLVRFRQNEITFDDEIK